MMSRILLSIFTVSRRYSTTNGMSPSDLLPRFIFFARFPTSTFITSFVLLFRNSLSRNLITF